MQSGRVWSSQVKSWGVWQSLDWSFSTRLRVAARVVHPFFKHSIALPTLHERAWKPTDQVGGATLNDGQSAACRVAHTSTLLWGLQCSPVLDVIRRLLASDDLSAILQQCVKGHHAQQVTTTPAAPSGCTSTRYSAAKLESDCFSAY